MKHKKYLLFIITFILFGQIAYGADLKQLAEQLVNVSIKPFEAKVYSETSTGTRFTSYEDAKAWNEKITALEKEGIAIKKEMEKKRDESVLQIEKSQRVEFLDNFNQTIFPRLNRTLSTLKEVPLDYYCNDKKEGIDTCGDGLDNDCDGVSKSDEERTGRNPQTGKEITANTARDSVLAPASDFGSIRGNLAQDQKGGDTQAQPRMAAERRAAARNMMDGTETPHMGLREGSDDPIPGIDVIVERDPSVEPVHFDGASCLDCGEEPVKLSDKTSEILIKAMPVIQAGGWKVALKEVNTEKYPKGTQAPAIPVKKVEKKKLFGLFGVEIETQAEINPQGEIQNEKKPWWSIFAW